MKKSENMDANSTQQAGGSSGTDALRGTLQVLAGICVFGALGSFLEFDGTAAVISAASCVATAVVFITLAVILEKVSTTALQVDWLAKEMHRQGTDRYARVKAASQPVAEVRGGERWTMPSVE